MNALHFLALFTISIVFTGDTYVYICNSKGAKKYHLTSSCRGLSNCQSKVIKTTLQVAKNKKRTLCGWEK
jgi:5-bromo-4-chloroindolyl phosphate hydrolysis protein